MLWPLSVVLVANTNGRLAIPALAGLLVVGGTLILLFVTYALKQKYCVFAEQNTNVVEKEQEAQLRAKYPGMKGPGTSALLQKRLAQKVRTIS